MKLPPRLEKLVDTGGLFVALVVDIVMNVICFSVLAPDFIVSIAFISIGVMIVLFVFRSWSRRQYLPWAIFVAVVFFFDYSFALEATRAQANEAGQASAIYADPEVSRLMDDIQAKDADLIDLRGQYDKAMKRETLAEIKGFIDVTQAKRDQYDAERKSRIKELQSKSSITSTAIFDAIPNAARDGRIIPLIVFGLIFLGLQLIVCSSIDGNKKTIAPLVLDPPVPPVEQNPVDPPEPALVDSTQVEDIQQEPETDSTDSAPIVTPDQVSKFVVLSWYRVDQHIDDHILPRESFKGYMAKRNIDFPDEVYDYLIKLSVKNGIMDKDGTIINKDKAESISILQEGLKKWELL